MDRNGMARLLHHLEQRVQMMDSQIMSISQVLKEIVSKELMRGQALHKVLMDKGLFTDADLKVALESLIAEAKADLEAESNKAKEAKQKAVEIIVPDSVRANSNQDATPTPAVIPVTDAPVAAPLEGTSGPV